MDYTTLAIQAAVLLISVYAYLVYWKYKDFPPGPCGLPLLGYAPFLGAKPHLTLENLAKKYGSVFSVNLGGNQTVVVNDWPSIKEVLVKQGDNFSSRPPIFVLQLFFENREIDIAISSGPIHKELKRTTMNILKNFGMGHSSLENVVVEQVEKLANELKTLDGQLVDISSVFFIPILNIIWGITAGITVDNNDPHMKAFAQALHEATDVTSIGILNVFPSLRYVAPEMTGYTKYVRNSKILYDYVEQVVDQHYEHTSDGQQTDLMHVFIEEIKRRNKVNKDQPPFCKEYLIGTALDMFAAGVEPINVTLHWGLLLMAHFPNIQKKVQQELDERIALDSHLPYSSKSTIPYTEATLCEIHRFASVSMLSIPHRAARDATLFGYKIPKGTAVLTNLWALHHDKGYWSDPEEFRPERFLDEEGRLKKHEALIPFSAGPRGCPGKEMGKLELTLFFSCMMRRFSFEMDPNRPSSTTESPLEPDVGMTLKPRYTSVVLKCR